VGWPAGPGDDSDTSGYLLVQAEGGWLGLALAVGGAVALAIFLVRAWHRAGGPLSRTAIAAGLGALTANFLYFGFDASALLAPNLIALAAVLGVATAWTAHGAAWRPWRQAATWRASHWPLVLGTTGLVGALALAENEMVAATPGHEANDKALHFGTFAIVSLLLAYALAPVGCKPQPRGRGLIALAVTLAMVVGVEYAQKYLTHERSFELMDMAAGGVGALAMAVWWWAVRSAYAREPPVSPAA
jgi:hypothetical protein